MTNLLKKALSVCMASTMLVTASCITVLAEDTQDIAPAADEVKNEAKVKFTIGEPDENGIFTAKLSLHNLKFVSLQFSFNFNKDVIKAVDAEGNPTDDFNEFAVCNPAKVEGTNQELTQVKTTVSNAIGVFGIISYIKVDTEDRLIHVDENGCVLYEFRFKKVGEGNNFGFALADNPVTGNGKDAIVYDGRDLSFTFEFIYPEESKEQSSSNYYPDVPDTNHVATPEELKRERRKGTVVLQVNNYAVSVEGIIKWVDKDNKNVVPYIENDRTMVPLRFISETFGADVEWIPETRTIEIALEDTKITMQLDNRDYQINGETKAMDTVPVIREDRTFVPIRFVSEALEKAVYWNGTTGVVVVAPLNNPWDDTDSLSQELMTQTLLALKWLGDEAYSHLKN